MEWLIAVMEWTGDVGKLLIQTEDERLFTMRVHSMDPQKIGNVIAAEFKIPRERVIYHTTKQTLYRKLTYMQYLVME